MALKTMFLRKKIDGAKKRLEDLREAEAEYQRREAELAEAVDDVNDETTDEERAMLEEEIRSFDAQHEEHRAAVEALEEEIRGMEEQLAELESRQDTTPKDIPAETGERSGANTMNTRSKIFNRMSVQERAALVERQDVKDYLAGIRQGIREKRAISNVGLTIPTVLLPLLKENVAENSVLYKHVNVVAIAGEGRQVIMGSIPEAVWTDCCANLNEFDLVFNSLELDCYRVGGFFAVCNANVEDSDIDLLAELISACGRAIGKALDKAILYGQSTGTKMPQGVVTRLAQESQPAGYPAAARAWVDLHSTNIRTINGSGMTGAQLLSALAGAAAYAKHKYTTGEKVWVMNETTWLKLVAAAITTNAAGAYVAPTGRTMPALGGAVEIMDDMADNDIVVGYFDLYTLGERRGAQFATSEHVRFLQDQTVIKGTTRYDGAPAIAEAFVVINIGNSTPAKSMSFASDAGNTVTGLLLPAAVSISGTSSVQLTATLLPVGVEGSITWASGTTSKATVSSTGVVTGVTSGTSMVTATCGGFTGSCLVTVT